MKAARFSAYGSADSLSIHEIDAPVPGRGEVAVDVVCAAINPVDVKIRAGSHRALLWWSLPHGTGMDLAGTVAAVGPDVSAFHVGQPVWSTPKWTFPGACQERTVVSADELGHLPGGIDFAQGAGIPLVGLTALQCLDVAGLAKGERLFVHGASGAVGMVAVQLGLQRGAAVMGTASPHNFERLRKLGPIDKIDRTGDWIARVGEADVVMIAADADVAAVVRAAKRGARVVHIVGDLPEQVAQRGPVLGALVAGWNMAVPTVLGWFRGVSCSHVLKNANAADLDRLADAVQKGLRVWVDSEYPLDRTADAHRRQEAGPSGKVIVRVRPDPRI